MDQEVILCRGIPASGKSTWSKIWVTIVENRVRISRDDIRFDLFGRYENVNEKLVTSVEDAMLTAALKAGASVVVDDCNIEPKYLKRLANICHENNVKVSIQEFAVNLRVAKERNAARERQVPNSVIDSMQSRLLKYQLVDISPPEVDKYSPESSLPLAIIVDIDGTIADRGSNPKVRSPYDWMRVDEDYPVWTVIDCVAKYAVDHEIIYMSGRDAVCRDLTVEWLDKYTLPAGPLHMRAKDDMRKDSIVKLELFDKFVRPYYNVEVVLDDRAQVVKMWRSIGLTVFQVAPGEF